MVAPVATLFMELGLAAAKMRAVQAEGAVRPSLLPLHSYCAVFMLFFNKLSALQTLRATFVQLVLAAETSRSATSIVGRAATLHVAQAASIDTAPRF